MSNFLAIFLTRRSYATLPYVSSLFNNSYWSISLLFARLHRLSLISIWQGVFFTLDLPYTSIPYVSFLTYNSLSYWFHLHSPFMSLFVAVFFPWPSLHEDSQPLTLPSTTRIIASMFLSSLAVVHQGLIHFTLPSSVVIFCLDPSVLL